MFNSCLSLEFSYWSCFYVVFRYFMWSGTLGADWMHIWSLMELKHMKKLEPRLGLLKLNSSRMERVFYEKYGRASHQNAVTFVLRGFSRPKISIKNLAKKCNRGSLKMQSHFSFDVLKSLKLNYQHTSLNKVS